MENIIYALYAATGSNLTKDRFESQPQWRYHPQNFPFFRKKSVIYSIPKNSEFVGEKHKNS
jgi:hypothetical protein